MTAITIPALQSLPTASHAVRTLKEVKRRSRKHTFRLAHLVNSCFLFAYFISSRRRKHPYLLWVSLTTTIGSFGVDYWFNRQQQGFSSWLRSTIEDIQIPYVTTSKSTRSNTSNKPTLSNSSSTASSKRTDSDLIIIENTATNTSSMETSSSSTSSNSTINGESVERDLERERRLQRSRAWFSGVALAMGIVGLWGDGA